MFELPNSIRKCMSVLESAGYEAWVVGGAVRDLCLGNQPADFDLATNALPENVMRLFKRVLKTGLKHGTVTVLLEDTPIEVTTYRADGAYSDCRRPDRIKYVSTIGEDLARRDFTINAMAYHPVRGIFDPFGGQKDLAGQKLKAVGEPGLRFEEDALRILRLFRFAARFAFEIDKDTFDAAIQKNPNLALLSRERIWSELHGILLSPYPSRLAPLLDCGGLSFLGVASAGEISRLDSVPMELALRFTAFCVLTHCDPASLCRALKTDNQLRMLAVLYTKELQKPLPTDLLELKRRLRDLPMDHWPGLFALREVLFEEDTASCLKMLHDLEKSGDPYRLSHLPVDGNDIRALGVQGRRVGQILNALLEICLQDPSRCDREVLLAEAKRLI